MDPWLIGRQWRTTVVIIITIMLHTTLVKMRWQRLAPTLLSLPNLLPFHPVEFPLLLMTPSMLPMPV
jgi:hypothetical protein